MFKNRFMGFMALVLLAEAGEGGDPGAGATTTTATTEAPPATGSVLGNVAAPSQDFIPEKYRTLKEDGSLDLEASSRKVAEAHKHLEARMGSGDVPPKTAEEYAPKVEVEGFSFDEFKADAAGQEFLKGAHAVGLTNDQVSYVIGEYLKAAPGLIEGNAQLNTQDCTTALKGLWGDDAAMKQNVQASYRAAQAFATEGQGPGNIGALMAKYGNDPDFIAFTANIGKELREDGPINGGGAVNNQDFAVKAAELRDQLQALPAHDPKRPGIQQQLDAMYGQRFNKPASRLA